MRIVATSVPGVLLLEPRRYSDARGFLFESFSERAFEDAGLPTVFAQENHSRSVRDVVRGLHYQRRQPQGKLVTVVSGRVMDVAVDIRAGSVTFGRWTSIVLDADEPRSLWIPPGFAHGFAVLSERADVLYKCTTAYDAADQHGIRWDDPALAIDWPVSSPILSAADQNHPFLADRIAELGA